MDSLKGAIVLRERFERTGVPDPDPWQGSDDATLIPLFQWITPAQVPTHDSGHTAS